MSDRASLALEAMQARPRLIAALAAHLRDLDLAEEAFDQAVEALLVQEDPPHSLPAWLLQVAKRKAIDTIRRRNAEGRATTTHAMLEEGDREVADVITLPDPIPDERLRLIFICCHPALALEARVALTLKIICGLPVKAIARVFLSSEPAMFQRITRAKTKVREAGIPFELPDRRFWKGRLDAVLLSLELAYTAAYQDAGGETDPELSSEIGRLANMVAELLPEEPEALGLAALVGLARSRENARVDELGAMIPLSKQDTAKWDMSAIEQARQWLDQAAEFQSSGPYQIMASIQLAHARRAFDGKTDWTAILALYDALLMVRSNPMVPLNRAMALAEVAGPQAALEAIAELPKERIENGRALHVAKAHLLQRIGKAEEAAKALDRALALDPPRAERMFLERQRIRLAAD